jgi:hypothetical protein
MNTNNDELNRSEIISEDFQGLISQIGQMAFMFLGEIPDPNTNQLHEDLGAAKLYIDQLEALNAKTAGNLSQPEKKLLTQLISKSQLLFVNKMESQAVTHSEK